MTAGRRVVSRGESAGVLAVDIGRGALAFGVAGKWIGKCTSCDFNDGFDGVDWPGLVCGKRGKLTAIEVVSAHWRCCEFESIKGGAS